MLTSTDEWQLQVYQAAGGHLEAMQREIAVFTKKAEAEIKAVFEDAGIKAFEADNAFYVAHGLPEKTLAQSENMIQLLTDTYQRTNGEIHNFTRTTAQASQLCLYPFNVVYRAAPKSEAQRLKIKEFLDGLGRWLEQQPVTIGGTEYRLTAYPSLSSGNRVIKSISRTNPGHLNAAYQDGIKDWLISATLRYENEFDR